MYETSSHAPRNRILYRRLSSSVPAAFLAALLLAVSLPSASHAITITIEHTPENENPSWDPDGSILTAHFQAAVAIWENVLPGSGDFEFDYHWDDDIDGLGMATPLGPIDNFIEINPTKTWFADPTPNDSVEFTFAPTSENGGPLLPSQQLFRDLSSVDRVNNFPGAASPPDTLEVMYRGFGSATFPSLQPGYNAKTGYDLLRTVVHEIGHILGINGIEPGDYNISPDHIGGIEDVLVREGDGGHLSGNNDAPGFLMCDSCGVLGRRVLPSATDILVVAEEKGITDVHLPRVGRISSGAWSNAGAWIGADAPDATQDAYIRHGGPVNLDADAQVKNLRIADGSNFDTMNSQLLCAGTLDFDTGSLTVGVGSTVVANTLNGAPTSLTTIAGALVRFNNYTQSATTPATSINFGGSVAISKSTANQAPVTFNVGPIAVWNIGQDLTIGDQNDMSVVVADLVNPGPPPTNIDAIWNVGGNVTVGTTTGNTSARGRLTVQNGGAMNISGNLRVQGSKTNFSEVTVDSSGTLSIGGTVTLGTYGLMTYKQGAAENITYNLQGGTTSVLNTGPPSFTYYFERDQASRLTFMNATNAGPGTINVDGGRGNDGPNAQVFFMNDSFASNATVHTIGGHRGADLPFGAEVAGLGGRVNFNDNARASTAKFYNDGSDFKGGTGGITSFNGQSSAGSAEFFNYGGTHANGSIGGSTQFDGTASASTSKIINYGSVALTGGGKATFLGSSQARFATITNEAALPSTSAAGFTAFRGNSTAGDADPTSKTKITNRGTPSGALFPGLTQFYDSAKGGYAEIYMNPGVGYGGRTEFRGSSNADHAKLYIESRTPTTGNGGSIAFFNNATAGNATITAQPNSFSAGVNFENSSNAGDATFVLEDGSSTFVRFFGQSKGRTADFNIGRLNQLQFYAQSNAENADVTVQPGGYVYTTGEFNVPNLPTATLGDATFHVLGSDVVGNSAGGMGFATWGTAGNATITVEGGTTTSGPFNPAAGGSVAFDYNSHAGTSKIILNGGTNGGAGAELYFVRGGKGDSVRIQTSAGAKVFVRNSGVNGDTTAASIEGAGRFNIAGGALFIVGSLNTDTTVSGQIVNEGLALDGTGGKLTKVGTGTLTLSGANTYTGDTNVDAGTLAVDGTLASKVIVKSGAKLMGSGSIAGDVTINSGATLAPGSSPGTLTVHNLSLFGGSTLNYELGTPRDHIAVTNSGTIQLGGTLNVSLFGGFMPTAGQSFQLVEGSIGSIIGAFSTLTLPSIGSLAWDTSLVNTSGILRAISPGPGDFNTDGKVDARDYVAWRKGLGTTYTQNDYNIWRAHFGHTAGSGSTAGGSAFAAANSPSSAVPEPKSLALFLWAVIGLFHFPRGCGVANNRC